MKLWVFIELCVFCLNWFIVHGHGLEVYINLWCLSQVFDNDESVDESNLLISLKVMLHVSVFIFSVSMYYELSL